MERRAVWADRYAIFDEVASGGMATVYVAGRLGRVNGRRVVAVKKLFEQFAKDPDFVSMFLDEARLAAQIRHPNVIRTHQVLRIPSSMAIVMDLVIGVSLNELTRTSRQRKAEVPVAVAGAVLVGALQGLHAAHEAKDELGGPLGLVHRDVSPHNILVGNDGIPRVIDFGVAKAEGRIHVTDVGVRKGKFAYMAPEQIRGREVDRRTDVYAAGIVLWELLVGRRLFTTSSDAEVLSMRAAGNATIAPPSAAGAKVPDGVDAVVLRALDPRPAARFATADEMASAVGDALRVAPPGDVAAWVVELAHAKLEALEAKVREVERAFASGELEEITQVTHGPQPWQTEHDVTVVMEAPDFDAASAPRPDMPVAPRLDVPAAPDLDLPPPRSGPRSAGVRVSHVPRSPDLELALEAPRSSRSSLPPRVPPADVAPPSRRPSIPSRAPAPDLAPPTGRPSTPSRTGATDPPLAGRPSIPSRAPSPERAPSSGRPSIPSRLSVPAAPRIAIPALPEAGPVRTGLVLGGAVLLVAVATRLLGPAVLRSLTVSGASKRGFSMSAESVSVEDWGLALHDAAFQLTDDPDVVLRAPTMRITLDWLGTPQKVQIRGYTLALRGGALDLAPRLAAWASASHTRLAIDATSGQLSWPDAIVPGVSVEARDVSLQALLPDAAATDAPSLHAETASLTATARGASLGPWSAGLDSIPDETKLVIHLDRKKPDSPPSVTLTASRTLGRLFSIAIPRQKATQLGLPPGFLAIGNDPEIDVSLEGQVFPGGDPLNAHAKVALFGVTIPALTDPGAPADVVVEGSVQGSPTAPLRIQKGVVHVRAASSPFSGVLRLDRGAVVVEVAPLALPVRATAGPALFDTRAWTGP